MIEDVLEAFDKWLYIDDWMPIEITVATALAVYFDGDPIWLLVCGPPGCLSKDEEVLIWDKKIKSRRIADIYKDYTTYNIVPFVASVATEDIITIKPAIPVKSGTKLTYELVTTKGNIIATGSHIFFKVTNSRTEETALRDLRVGDKVLYKNTDKCNFLINTDCWSKLSNLRFKTNDSALVLAKRVKNHKVVYDLKVPDTNNFITKSGIVVHNSGKTEVVRTLSGDRVYSLDTLSQNSLVSGLTDKKSNQKFGIIQDIDGKVLAIKDLTVLLQSSKDMENNVFNQLRAAYDGEYAAAHGSGHKRQAYKSRFGFIAAVTEIIDSYRALSGALGERFITIRVGVDSEKAIKRAQENTGKEFYMRTELKQAIADTIEYYSIVGKTNGLPILPDEDLQKLRFLGEITAKLRTEVHKGYFRKSEVVPGLEVGTRLVKQLTRLGQLLMLIESYKYSKITRVARDCMSKRRLNTAKAIYKNIKANPWEMQKTVKETYSNLKNDCEDLWRLGICEKEDRGRSSFYSYKDDLMEKIILSEIFEE